MLNVRPLWIYLHIKVIFLLAFLSGTEEKILRLSFFHGCRKRRLKEYQRSHLRQTAQTATTYVYNILSFSFWRSMGVSEEYLIFLCHPFENKA
jgi:hypothetical protein